MREDPPLAGVRVLDFTQALSGPYCTLVLADLGAEVIKVEAPGRGDDSRHWGPPFVDTIAAYFYSVNRNKRSVVIDLKNPQGLDVVRDLARACDVAVENWRPGVAKRLGVDFDSLVECNSALIYCSLSGFGAESSPRAGYDQVIQGMSGIMSLTGPGDGVPTKAGVGLADITSGMFCAHAVLAALWERDSRRHEKTLRGRYIDVAMLDSAIALLAYQATRYTATGTPPHRDGNYHATIAPYAAFATRDGYVNICVANDLQWRDFCHTLRLDELLVDERYATNPARVANRSTLYPTLENRLAREPTAELLARLEEAGVPAGPIRTLDEVFSDPHLKERGAFLTCLGERGRTIDVPGAPWHFDGQATALRCSPPTLGADTADVLAGVGYDAQRVRELCDAEAIACSTDT